MNWPEYPKYYNSGLPWIGPIPSHWSLVPNRAFLELKRRPVGSQSGTFTLLSLTLRGVIQRDISENKGKFPAAFDTYQEVDTGDLVFCLFDIEETPRTVGLSPHRGMITGAYDVFRVSSHVNARYIEYLYLSLDQRKSLSYFYSGLRKVIRMPTFKGIRSPLPPLDEQHQIASFLDGETAKIDALIAKQEQLIATLREDRAATITHAVTKGLNPDVEMKKAEAPWIGQIPAHWGATKFSRLGKFTSGSGFPHEYQGLADNEIAFLKVNALGRANHSGYITTRDDTVSPGTARELGAKIFDANTVVFAKVGAALLLGRICLTASKSCIDNNMMAFIPNSSILPEYARFLLQQIPFDLLVNPGAVPSVNEGQLRSLPAACPPVAEQLAIVSHLAERCQKIDVLIDVSIEMIETLREYRSALITNAVTGKIDVREAV